MKNKSSTILTLLGITFIFCSTSLTAQETVQFTVQVATVSAENVAAQKVSALKAKGLSAFFTPYQTPDKQTIYRINVGHLPTRARAQKFRQTLVNKYGLSPDAFVRELEDTTGRNVPVPLTGFKVESTNLPTPTPAPTATPVPSPTPQSVALPNAATPMVEAQPSPSPLAEASVAEKALPSPTPAPTALPVVIVAPEKTRSSFSIVFTTLVDSTNYSVNFPPAFGTTGLQNTLTSTSLIGGGFGLLPTLSLSQLIELQSGLILFQRSYNVAYNNGLTIEPGSESYTALEVPLLVFFNLFNHVALGVGGYVISNPAGTITQSTFGGPIMPDANLSGSDWGATGALNFSFDVAAQTDLVISARYNYGNGNMPNTSSNPIQVFSDYQLFAGLRFYLSN